MGLLLVGVTLPSFADEIGVPFAIHVEDFKADALEHDFDLYDGDGFIQNKGSRFVVYTYKRVTPEQLSLITELTWKHLRR